MYFNGRKLGEITEEDIQEIRENKVIPPSPNYPIEGVGLWDILDSGAEKVDGIEGYHPASDVDWIKDFTDEVSSGKFEGMELTSADTEYGSQMSKEESMANFDKHVDDLFNGYQYPAEKEQEK